MWTRVMIRCQSGKLTDPALLQLAVIMNTTAFAVRFVLHTFGPTHSSAHRHGRVKVWRTG